ncbi:polyphosphate kinase 1 [Synechococcus sp. PCC 7336]|uniref:polyphosphate kinase 1 n=1 Tax=Synechococcus sp. PCC 7336 TaxID=195250 RepID=UPI0003476989|nr:polyphosphate kinase 1 [Synechococcus sp. PCC 7336]
MTAPDTQLSSPSTPKSDPHNGAGGVQLISVDGPAELTLPTEPLEKVPPEYYLNRELSWLEFNRRVLHEALDDRTPLLERLKFLGIFSSNLDEFFMVRVAAIQQQIEAGVTSRTADGLTPPEQLGRIQEHLRPIVAQQHKCFEKVLRPALAQLGVRILSYADLDRQQQDYLKDYFECHIFPILTPLAVDPGHPFPYISNLSLNLAVLVYDPRDGLEHFARVKVPRALNRFIQLGDSLDFVPLEHAIGNNLEPLFEGMEIRTYHPFRITRNADLAIEEEEAGDLLLAIEEELRKQRLGGSAVRLELSAGTPDKIRNKLVDQLELDERCIYEIDGLLGLDSLFAFMSLDFPGYKDTPWTPTAPPRFRHLDSDNPAAIFAAIRKGDILVHHPYDSFSGSVLRFIQAASRDRNVMSIKQTLYRTSGDSPVIQALIDAAAAGKQVAVLVELKARFDEANNIQWARRLENAGVHVVYGVIGLKTHTKLSLAVRKEDDCLRSYVHIGTGNYNPKTARLYTDLGLFSCDEALGADAIDLFNFLTGYSHQQSYRKLLVAPVSLRSRITEMIRRETARQRRFNQTGEGKGGRIIAKMNSLVDAQIIEALYEAGKEGVEIDLIVRGICCLRPGVPGLSESIRVISVIGRFLEHSRIFYFANGGEEEIYIGSADWMTRNLDRRVEAVTPVSDPKLMAELLELLRVMLADNRQAWDLQSDGSYKQRRPHRGKHRSTHQVLMARALER